MHILMLVENNFPWDPRVGPETEKLIEYGYKITVIAIRHKNQRYIEKVKNLNIYRIPKIELFVKSKQTDEVIKRSIFSHIEKVKSILGYGLEYVYFTSITFIISVWLLFRYKFDVIHLHNPPDTLCINGIFWKLLGKKMIFDHHDLATDLYLAKFDNKKGMIYRILWLFEKWSCEFADIVISTNESYKKIIRDRYTISEDKIFVVRNGPDLNKVKIAKPLDEFNNDNFYLCYLGTINKQDGVDNLVKILNILINKCKRTDMRLLVIGDGDYLFKVKELAQKYNIESFIIFTGFINGKNEINRYLSSADIFIDAAPDTFVNDHSTFIKHMEYMVFKKPVVSYELKESMYTLGEAGIFIKPGDNEAMADQIIALLNDKEKMVKMGEIANKRVPMFEWDVVSQPLLEAYKYLLSR